MLLPNLFLFIIIKKSFVQEWNEDLTKLVIDVYLDNFDQILNEMMITLKKTNIESLCLAFSYIVARESKYEYITSNL